MECLFFQVGRQLNNGYLSVGKILLVFQILITGY